MAPKSDKTKKVANMPTAEGIEGTKTRTFSAVTTMGNKFTTDVKNLDDDDEKYSTFVKGVHETIATLVSIAFEKADINDLVTNHEKFKKLQFFDPSAIFSAEANSLKIGQVLSILTDIQTKMSESAQSRVLTRLEKVSLKA